MQPSIVCSTRYARTTFERKNILGILYKNINRVSVFILYFTNNFTKSKDFPNKTSYTLFPTSDPYRRVYCVFFIKSSIVFQYLFYISQIILQNLKIFPTKHHIRCFQRAKRVYHNKLLIFIIILSLRVCSQV